MTLLDILTCTGYLRGGPRIQIPSNLILRSSYHLNFHDLSPRSVGQIQSLVAITVFIIVDEDAPNFFKCYLECSDSYLEACWSLLPALLSYVCAVVVIDVCEVGVMLVIRFMR